MNGFHARLFIVFILVLLLGIRLLPDDDEHITMLLRDKHYSKAFRKLKERFAAGDRQRFTLMRLYELHELYGNEEEMQRMLAIFRAKHPDDIFVQEKLADLFFRTSQYERYLNQLELLIKKAPKREYAEKLIARLELNGDITRERKLLEKFQSLPFFSAEHAGRLGLIELNSGNNRAALRHLKRMDQIDQNNQELSVPRLALFRLLLKTGQADEAANRAGKWIRRGQNVQNLFLLMTMQLQERGRNDLAIRLATDAQRQNSAPLFYLVEYLVRRRQILQARILLDNWRNGTAKPSNRERARYIVLQLEAQNPLAAIAELNATGIQNISADDLVKIGEELALQNQTALLRTLQPFFHLKALQRRPLFAAKLFAREGKSKLAAYFLKKTPVATLRPYVQMDWVATFNSVHGDRKTLITLREMKRNGKLSRHLLKGYAELAGKLGEKNDYESAWIALGGMPARRLR